MALELLKFCVIVESLEQEPRGLLGCGLRNINI
jgi:hypothetical protein